MSHIPLCSICASVLWDFLFLVACSIIWGCSNSQGEGVQNSGKTSTDVRGRDMGVEEGTGKEIGGRRNENATMDVRSYEAGQDQK